MRWVLGLLVLFTAAPALAFEGEIDAKSIGDASAGAVEFQIFVSKGGQTSGLEVTRMQGKKVAASKFGVPPGYQVQEMPEMPSGVPT